MSTETHEEFYRNSKASDLRRARQITAALIAALAVASCGSEPVPAPGATGVPLGFSGEVVADEPRAARIGRDVLLAGGSASDAAVAMYFAMAVTLPSRASLGGGGVCIAFRREMREPEAVEFLPRAPLASSPAVERPTAVPGAVRGFSALHGRYGRLRWAQLLAPAEELARFGVPVSRAFARDLTSIADAIATEPGLNRRFRRPDGTGVLGEGDTLLQPELANAIAGLRTEGQGDFYSGALAASLVAGARMAGGTIDGAELAAYQPAWRQPLTIGASDLKTYVPPPPPAGGAIAGQIWAMLVKDDGWIDAMPADRPAIQADAAARAFADRATWPASGGDAQALVGSEVVDRLLAGPAPRPRTAIAENPAAATLVAIDREGSAVACAVTVNNLFGTGRFAEGTGILLAAAPGAGGRGATMLAPMLTVRQSGRQFVFAGAASGGAVAPTALDAVAAQTLLAQVPLVEAVAAPRTHAGTDPEFAFVEPGVSEATTAALAQRGFRTATVAELGRVNAIACPDGLPDAPSSCTAVADPRGAGMAVSTE